MIADDDIVENFLCCKEVPETTKGQDIFNVVDEYLQSANLSWDKCIGICTDGAPAMTGIFKGFTSFAKKKNPKIIFTHCSIYREALVTESLAGDLGKVLDQVVKVINYIKSRPLKSRLFQKICEKMDAKYSKLLLHSAIRWLSRGRVLSQFYDLKEEIVVFLILEESAFEFLGEETWWTKVSSLTDLFEHLNKLNSSMQSRNENILTSSDKISADNKKLSFWKIRINQKNLSMFPRTAEREMDALLLTVISESVLLLQNKIMEYFPSININEYDWVRNPINVSLDEVAGLEVAEEEDLCSLKNNRMMMLKFQEVTLSQFWLHNSAENPNISRKAVTILSLFSTSYLCEQGFSALTAIKSKKREKLDSVEQEMRVYLSRIRPRIKDICKIHQAQISH